MTFTATSQINIANMTNSEIKFKQCINGKGPLFSTNSRKFLFKKIYKKTPITSINKILEVTCSNNENE